MLRKSFGFLALVVLTFFALPSHADNFKACSNNEIQDPNALPGSALCYPTCKPGYVGTGPVCYSDCPDGYSDDGVICRKNAIITAKASYGRGAGSPMGCGSGKEKDGALCYPACKSGYYGVGPVCWAHCDSGYRDDGATCYKSILHFYAKDTYGRGAGSPLNSCGSGEQQNGQLCYPDCKSGYSGAGPVCWENCPSGYHDDGATCRKDADIFAKSSYGRGAGHIPSTCNTSSFTKTITSKTKQPFTMVISGDVQLPWWQIADPTSSSGESSDPNCNSTECVKTKAIQMNENLIAAIASVQSTLKTWPNSSLLTKGAGTPITAPVGLIINGDLTAYFHPEEEELYRQFYHAQFTLPVYPGLGNHDYSNNVKTDTSGSQGCSDNVCADRAIKYLKSTINCSAETNFPATQVSNYDDGSMAYSFEIGKYHFVQLNFYPGYTKTEISVTSSNAWLKKDLAAATKAGKRIVINLHTNDSEAWASDSDFLSAIQNQNVVAIFGAHIHPNSGFQQYLSNGTNTKIPFIRSGSPHFSRFMLVQFGDDYINFAILSDTAGVPAFVSTTDSKYLGTY